jgi:hypothetical protein
MAMRHAQQQASLDTALLACKLRAIPVGINSQMPSQNGFKYYQGPKWKIAWLRTAKYFIA